MNSPRLVSCHTSALMPQPRQVRPHDLLQSTSLRELLSQLRRQTLHLLVEGLIVIVTGGGANKAAGGEHEAVLGNLLGGGAPAEAGDVFIDAGALLAAPRVERAGDSRNLLIGQLAVCPIDHHAHLAGVDEQRLAAAVAAGAAAPRSVALVARQEPQAHRDLRRV